MDDEQERQRRDLQRAIELLETMPREEIVEMLLDILSNERSDYTRKLSDWMAFQIILHDDTRHEREMLAQLGKGGRNNQRSQTSQTPSVSPHCPTCAVQSSKSQGDSLTESSSSTRSFATCPEAEPAKAIQTNDNVAHDGALVEVPAISGTLANATVTQIDERPDFGDILAASESEEKGPRRFRAKLTSWLLRRRDTTLRRKQQAPSESITSSEDPQPKDSVILVKSGAQPVTGHDSVASMILPGGSDEIRQDIARFKATSVTNALGHKNLAELYARYARVQEGSNGACDEYEDNDASTSDLDVSEIRQWLEKMQCKYCRLYFTHEQNVRDLVRK